MIGRAAISELSTPGIDWAGDLVQYVEAGAGGVGMTEDKLLPGGELDALALFIESGLKATLSRPTVGSLLATEDDAGPADPAERAAAITASVRRLAAFDPVAVAIDVGPIGDADDRAAAVDGLRQIARVAVDLHPRGVAIALRCGGAGLSIDAARELTAEVAEPGLWLVLDGCASAAGEQLERAVENVGAIACVELRGPVDPGLESLMAELAVAGYRGYYELVLAPDRATDADAAPQTRLATAVTEFRAVHDAAIARVGAGTS